MYTLTVDMNGPGGANGRVDSQPGGITCGSSCTAQFADGTDIELMGTPGQNSFFGAWEGGFCSGTSRTCRLRLTKDAHVTAVFQFLVEDDCTGLGPTAVGAPDGSALTMVDQIPVGPTTDGAGVVALPGQGGEMSVPLVSLDLYDRSGKAIGYYSASNLQVAEQLTGFIVSDPGSPDTYGPGQLAVLDEHGNVTASMGPSWTAYDIAANPLGGVVAIGNLFFPGDSWPMVTWFDEELNVKWSVSLPKGASVPAFAVDREGNTLLLFAGFGSPRMGGMWIDRDGTTSAAFDAGPSLQQPMLSQRVGNGLFLGAQNGKWISQFAPFSGPTPAPDWLALRPAGTTLHMARNGRGYAVIAPPVNTTGPCSTSIEVIAPSGKSCGTALFASPPDENFRCQSAMWVGYDGTAIQQIAPVPVGDRYRTPVRWWAGYFH
jgi:hypothetical protein